MSDFKAYVRSRWDLFWLLVDHGNVVVNQMVFYVLIFLSCVYNYFGPPLQAMQESSSAGLYSIWIWLCILSPVTTVIGKLCKGSLSYTGLWMELTGDTTMWVIFFCYVYAVFDTVYWEKGLFGAFLAIACLIGTPVFIVKDIRQLRRVEGAVRGRMC